MIECFTTQLIYRLFCINFMVMNATVQLSIPLTTNQLASLIREQLPREERLKLISLLQQEETEPTDEQILNDFRADLKSLKQGTLKTRPLQELLNEL